MDYLPGVNIWGASLCARAGKILHETIPNWLKWCDKLVLMMDNEDPETHKICKFYKKRYPSRVFIAHTGFDRLPKEKEGQHLALFHRFKPLQGPLREKVFQYFRDLKKSGENVDILVFPDSDELFTDSMGPLLASFWKDERYRAITMKPVDIFGDYQTIHNRSMTGHTRVLKFDDDITAIPYRTACNYRPLTKQNRLGSSRVLVHLASWNPDIRSWREHNWKGNLRPQEALWKLPKDIRKMTYEELHSTLKSEPDLTVEEYMRGGDKRQPMGVKNASKALIEASDMLNKLGVRHFLAFGTALGLARDKEIIKWDWDIDLIILAEDQKKLSARAVSEYGFTAYKNKTDLPQRIDEKGVESGDLRCRTISFKKYGVRIDLDPAYASPDWKWRYVLKGRKRQKFAAKHPYSMFGSPDYVDYKKRRFNIPGPKEEYLESNYGKDWREPSYMVMRWEKRPCFSPTYDCQ